MLEVSEDTIVGASPGARQRAKENIIEIVEEQVRFILKIVGRASRSNNR